VQHVHIMQPIRHPDAFRVGRHLATVGDFLVAMPEEGREDRREFINETVRYIRGVGCHYPIQTQLADVEYMEEDNDKIIHKIRMSALDMVELGVFNVLALGPRTNEKAHACFKSIRTRDEAVAIMDVTPVTQTQNALPLSHYFGFGGDAHLIAWNTPDGHRAVDAVMAEGGMRPWRAVFIPEGCHFLSYECGAHTVSKFDIIVQEGFPEAYEILGKHGLHPIPTKWTEMAKLNVSMRECIIRLKFMKAGQHADSERERRHSPDAVEAGSYMFSRNVNRMPDWAYANTLPDPVFQPPPRYLPPMHKKGPPAVINRDD
jgi:hypothetical protein